jgi:hypothetical protein
MVSCFSRGTRAVFCCLSLATLVLLAVPAGAAVGSTPMAPADTQADQPLRLQVRDAWTGVAVAGAVARAPGAPDRLSAKAGSNGVVELSATPETLEISAPAYESMTLHPVRTPEARAALATGPDGSSGGTAVWLKPTERPEELRIDSIRARTAPNTTMLHGHVIDVARGTPVAGATVRIDGTDHATTTDEDGYFVLYAQGTRVTSPDQTPEFADLLIEADGFSTVRLAYIALLEEDSHYIVDLERGTGEIVRDVSHKMFPQGESIFDGKPAEKQISLEEARAVQELRESLPEDTEAGPTLATKATFGGLQVVNPPDQIYVSGYGYIPLEVYIARGLCGEWISSWGQESLNAGSIAYRSYGSWYQINQGYICTTTSCQVYNNTYNSKCDTAAQTTSGVLLELNGSVAFSEYSAENNSYYCSSLSCVNSDLSCGDNYAGSPGAGWSCLYDNHGFTGSPGRCCFGHGRGMCQWGTYDWDKQGQLWNWMVDHYYNDTGSGSGDRTMDMTTPLGIVTASPSTSSAARGSTISLSMTVRSYADWAHTDLMFGASLLGPSSHSDPAHDTVFTAPARSGYGSSYRDTTTSRYFTISSGAGAGYYDLLVAIWKDTNGNGQVDGSDLVLRTGRFDNAVYVY